MKKFLIGSAIALAAVLPFATVAFADPPDSNPGADCSQGNSGATCVPDPNENGQDCEAHGNENPAGNDGNENHCTTAPPTSPIPTTTTATTPPPVGGGGPAPCPGSFTRGPWFGDPRTNITLIGEGTFVVKGGVQRFSNTSTFTETLACKETFRIGRYKVENGHFLRIYQDGVLVLREKPPVLN